ncbi:MAG: glycosyltransferase, partial [Myxococcota bacterium]|nr:glycosyltransferase [Myxococcota bacterium]
MPKKICMVAYTHYHQDARPRRAAEALVARGDEVDFLGLAQEGLPARESVGGVQLYNLRTRKYRGGGKLRYVTSYLDFFLRCLMWITKHQLTRRYDVIYLHTMPDFIVFSSSLARLLGARVVLDVHDMMPELFLSKFELPGSHPLIRFLKLQERLSCRFADHVVCVHEPHRELLEERCAVKSRDVSVLMNLPDPTVFGADKKRLVLDETRAPRLVYHGTVARRLGLDLALRAFVRVRETYPEARFDIYGGGDASEDVRALVAELGLEACVGFEGRAFKLDDVPAMLEGAT